ncbi:Retrovirus-related Pol polyprotein from transposon 17.6, partial [Mucuna pruriens]
MDTYSNYNQIRMHSHDETKTTFIKDTRTLYYKVMPFGATYQQLMDKIFKSVMGRDMEVYIDNMVVKSTIAGEHCNALRKVFDVLRKHQLKLNLENCSFKIQVGKFLGFMLIERGIEANPKNFQAIIDMRSPRNIKEV